MITVKYQLQLLKIKSERANQNLFSTYSPKIALIQHARQPDLTQIRKSEHSKGDQFMLFVAYCSLYARACDKVAENACFQACEIIWLDQKHTPTIFGKRKYRRRLASSLASVENGSKNR